MKHSKSILARIFQKQSGFKAPPAWVRVRTRSIPDHIFRGILASGACYMGGCWIKCTNESQVADIAKLLSSNDLQYTECPDGPKRAPLTGAQQLMLQAHMQRVTSYGMTDMGYRD